MHRLRALGVGLAVVSFAGYAAGVWTSYPGRAFSITGLMVGLAIATIGGEA